MGLPISVSNSTITKWLKETLTMANTRSSGGSMEKAVTSHTASEETSVQTIIEAGNMGHTSTVYGHYIRGLPREVLVRIIQQTSGSIQEMNTAAVATEALCDRVMNPHIDA